MNVREAAKNSYQYLNANRMDPVFTLSLTRLTLGQLVTAGV